MPIIRGDRIGESRRLNLRSIEAQDFYTRFVSKVPDDFLRFRLSLVSIAAAMYPRQEPTPGMLRRMKRLLAELGTDTAPGKDDAMWRTWEVDGVTFAELATGQPRGNRYHRTPEPPWSKHPHQGACMATAIHRAREWGHHDDATALSLQLKELRDRKRTGTREGPRPDTPPSVPSVPSFPINNNGTQQHAPGAHEELPPDPPPLPAALPALDTLDPTDAGRADEVIAHWATATKTLMVEPCRDEYRAILVDLLAHFTPDELKLAVDGLLAHPDFNGRTDLRNKRQPVMRREFRTAFKNAERVAKLLAFVRQQPEAAAMVEHEARASPSTALVRGHAVDDRAEKHKARTLAAIRAGLKGDGTL